MKRAVSFCLLLLLLWSACPVLAADSGSPKLPPAEEDSLLLTGARPAEEQPAARARFEQPLKGVKIGIDPGHQRVYDPHGEFIGPHSKEIKQKVAGGCVGIRSGVMEYEVNMNVGLYLADLLRDAGAEVFLTHDTLDVNISNSQRAKFFNTNGVDLGIRLHCNKTDSKLARGAIMLVPSPGCTEHFIANLFIGLTILDRYCEVTGLPRRQKAGMLEFRNDQAGFNWCTRPIVCLEMGYLSNAQDDSLLSSADFQQKMARGIFEGICDCFDENGRLYIS